MAVQELAPGIVADPEIMDGQPFILGHRMTVAQIIGLIVSGESIEDVQEMYHLTEAEVQAALNFRRIRYLCPAIAGQDCP
jgi:uncharacterized protein (DUF433 family)